MLPQQHIPLRPCPKGYTLDQDKACSPQETVDRFLQRLREVDLDILKEVRRIDNGRLHIPVYFSVCGRDARQAIGTKKQMGKGSTPAQARASACMELAERFSFFSFVKDDAKFIVGDHDGLLARRYPLLDMEVLLQSVHDTTHSPKQLATVLGGLPLRWTWATHLGTGQDQLIPFSWFFAINEFNGPAAGNTMEEAILQGLSEVVERHVCARVQREQLPVPAIDLDTVTDPVARDLIDKFRQQGIRLHCFDFSLDTAIPTVGAVAWDPATFPEKSEIVYTAGTTPDPSKAMIRAITEVAQLAGDFNSGANYVASGLPKPRSLEEIDFLFAHQQTIGIDAMVDQSDPDICREVHNLISALDHIGLGVLALDTSHPALQIPACYTIVPGCHFRERASSGDAMLFAAKLAFDLLPPPELDQHLDLMHQVVGDRYYLDFYRGRNLYDQGMVEAALACFQRARERNPHVEDLPSIYSYGGCCLRDLGRHDEAIVLLQQGLAYDEERPDIHNILGVCHFKQGDHAMAVHHFQRAVDLNPASAIDYANLALNLERLGRDQEALANYEIALSQDPSLDFARQGLTTLLARLA